MRKTSTAARLAAAVAAPALLLGVAACSQDDVKDAASNATESAASATDKAGEATDAAKDKAGEATDKAGEATDKAKDGMSGDTTDVAEGDLPSEISDLAAQSPEMGAFKGAQTTGDNYVATYENGMIAFNKETGAQPLVGRIAETWEKDGGLENKIGLPTAPEQALDQGWEQTFQNGKIEWMTGLGDTDGNYGAKYVEN